MRNLVAAALLGLFLSASALAAVQPYPASFGTMNIPTNGTQIYVRVGGAGPAVVLLHGFGETGDMWAPLAADLARDHFVIVPDLRGMGLSSRPAGGYDKKTQAEDIAGVLDLLKIDKADLVTHDIGNMVGYAFAAQHPERVKKFVIIDAPLPGIGPWDDIVRSHALWHFSFYAPPMPSGWSRGASESISIGSGTNFPPTPKNSTKRRASTMPNFTRRPVLCMPVSSSSRRLSPREC